METLLYFIFLANTIIFLIHEMDGAYWKEWNMFSITESTMPEEKGLTIYLLVHIPIILLLFAGLHYIQSIAGLVISFVLSLYLIFHFTVHMLAKKQGRGGFEFPVSTVLFFLLFFVSFAQLAVTTYILIARYIRF
jgi:hypothetical protein